MNQFIRFPIQIITSGIIEFMYTSHFRVYACLDSHKNRKSQAFPSLETIRMKTKLNRGTIQKTIKDLIEWQLIKKAHIRRERGRGYRTIYTIIKEPLLKIPHKKTKEKIFSNAQQKRDFKGKFTGQKQPSQRTVLKPSKQPSDTAVIRPIRSKKSKQPSQRAATNKPYNTAVLNEPEITSVKNGCQQSKSKQPVDTASNQSLTSIEPVKKEIIKKESLKSKTFIERKTKKPKDLKLDTSEGAFSRQMDEIFSKKKKPILKR